MSTTQFLINCNGIPVKRYNSPFNPADADDDVSPSTTLMSLVSLADHDIAASQLLTCTLAMRSCGWCWLAGHHCRRSA